MELLSADTEGIIPWVNSAVEIIVVLQPVVILRHAYGEVGGVCEEAVALGGVKVGTEHTQDRDTGIPAHTHTHTHRHI